MLVLTRRNSEALIFPKEDIKIHVLEVRGNKVRLGIEAPHSTEIIREEIWCQISQELKDYAGMETSHAQSSFR